MAANAGGFQIVGRLSLVGPDNLRQITSKIHKDLSSIKGTIDLGLKPGMSAKLSDLNHRLQTLRGNLNSLNQSRGLGNVAPQFQNISRQSAAAAKSVRTFGGSVAASTKSIAAFTLGAGSLLATLQAVKTGIGEAIDAQDAFVTLRQVSGQTEKGLGSLKRTVTNLSTTWGASSKELIDASQTLMQAGFSSSQTEKALATLAKANKNVSASFGSTRDSVEAAIAVMGQFDLSADKLESTFGSLNAVSKKFAVESENLTELIRISGSQWKNAGGDLNSLLAAFTSVRSASRESSSSIAQGLKTITARLSRGSTRRKLTDLLGIDFETTPGQLDAPLVMIKKLHDATAHLKPGSTVFADVAEAAAGIRQLGKVIPLIRNYSVAVEAEAVAQRGANSLTQDAIVAQNSLAIQISKTREEWKSFYRELVDSSGFKTTVGLLLQMGSAAATLAKALIPLAPALTAIAGVKLSKMAFGAMLGKASGGYIAAGRGGVDDVPAMLSKGEYVLNANATRRIGKRNLDAVNSGGAKHFARGGSVGGGYAVAPAEGGLTSVMRELVSVIRDEVSLTRESLASKRLEKGNSIPLTGDAGYSLASNPSRRARARAAVQSAMALPLSRMSFDESAAAVVAGGHGDFRSRPATYNLAPDLTYHERMLYSADEAPRRSRNFRAMSRAEREQRIQGRGRGGLLSSIRQNALNQLQSD